MDQGGQLLFVAHLKIDNRARCCTDDVASNAAQYIG